MTDSVCTAYESRKQHNDSLSTIKGIVFMTKYNTLSNAYIPIMLFT